jgi:hypothetical protein
MSAEKPTNKPYPEDTEETVGEVGTPEQQSTEMRGTSDVVQSSKIPPALEELAKYVNEQCTQLWEYFVRNQLLINHPNEDVARTILGVVDDACSSAQNEQSFRKCLATYNIVGIMAFDKDKHDQPICKLIQRLIMEELRREENVEALKSELEMTVTSAMYRLNIDNKRREELERDVIGNINIKEWKSEVDFVIERVKSMAVQRLKPLDFRNFVSEAVINEFEGKLTIYVKDLPKAGAPTETVSFVIVNNLKDIGKAYLGGRDSLHGVTDLSRPEKKIVIQEGKGGKNAGSLKITVMNFTVTIPAILQPAIDRFLRMGWIPDGTATEFLDAIQDKIKVIKTPEELFADTLSRVLSAFRWVTVNKTGSGEYVLESDIPISSENPWQRYVYLVSADGEIWVPYPIWQEAREMFEKARVPRNMVEHIIKNKKTGRSAKTCESDRSIEMHNLIVLDVAKIEDALNDKVENYIVFREPPCEGETHD